MSTEKSAVHDDLVSALMRPKNSRGPDAGYLRMLVGHSYPDLLEWSMSTPRCTRFCVLGGKSLRCDDSVHPPDSFFCLEGGRTVIPSAVSYLSWGFDRLRLAV